MVGPRWKLEPERAYFCFVGTVKTYNNLWEGKNKVILINIQ
jgi:hypothetical protein